MQRRIAQDFQVAALEARVRLFANDAFEQLRDLAQYVGGRFVAHAERRQRAQLLGAAEIAHAALQDVGVRENNLLARLAAQSSALDADVLDRAGEGVQAQAVADDEGLVQSDRQRGEQIAEDVLQGERHCHAADAEAGEQGGDVDAEIAERDQDQDRPYDQARDEIDDVERAREDPVGAAFPLLELQIETQGAAGPQSDLSENEDQHDVVEAAR